MSASEQLTSVLNRLDTIDKQLNEYERTGEKKVLSMATKEMKQIAPLLKELGTNPECKTKENIHRLIELSNRMKEAVERTKVLSQKPEQRSSPSPSFSASPADPPPGVLTDDYVAPTNGSSNRESMRWSKPLIGYLKKQGQKGVIKGWKKRWFQQRDMKLFYFESENSPESLGSINLELVTNVLPNKEKDGFSIHTKDRIYQLQVLREQDLNYWIDGLKVFLATRGVVFPSETDNNNGSRKNFAVPPPVVSYTDIDDNQEQQYDSLRRMPKNSSSNESSMEEGSGSLSNDEDFKPSSSVPVNSSFPSSAYPESPSKKRNSIKIPDDDLIKLRQKLVSMERVVSLAEEKQKDLENKLREAEQKIQESEERVRLAEEKRQVARDARDKAENGMKEMEAKYLAEVDAHKEQRHWEAELEAKEKALDTLRTKYRLLEDQSRVTEERMSTSIETTEQLRRDIEAKDKYISGVLEQVKSNSLTNFSNISSSSSSSKSTDKIRADDALLDKLHEALQAHKTQNGFLLREIQKLEQELKLQNELKNEAVANLQRQLEEARSDFTSLRQKLIGSSQTEYIEKLESENRILKKEYFLSLGIGVKLHRSVYGTTMPNIDLITLYEAAISEGILFQNWPEWISHKFEEHAQHSFSK